MKKIILSIVMFCCFATLMQAQTDRTHAPKPGPAPVIEVGEPASFILENGLRVFVVQNTKLPRVSATLTIDREAIREGDKAGLVSMAGELLRRGTTKMNKAVLDEEIDYLGATVTATARSISGFSLKNNFPKVMELMADIALRPSFPADELEKIRKQELSGLAQSKEDPSAISQNVTNALLYGKSHPYGELETEETVARVTAEDIKRYHATYWKPNIAYLILVGDITLEEARKLVVANFSGWQRATVPAETYPVKPAPAKTYIAIVDRPASVQSVITLVTPVQLKPGATDAIPASVMNNLLGVGSSARLYKTLREKYGFTYGAYSRVTPDRLVGNFTASASVRNEKTDSAIGQFIAEFKKLRSEPVTAAELSLSKNEMNGSFARSLENPQTIASFALNVARYNLPKDYYQTYLQRLSAVNAEMVKQMADKYVLPGNLHIIIVGNAKQIAKGLEKYGEIRYFDNYGNEKAAPVDKKVSATVSAESILKKAIDAQGGATAMATIKDVTMTGKASVMGQNIDYLQQYILPGGFLQNMSMGGASLGKQLMKNDTYAVTQQGQAQELKEEDKEELRESASLFAEAYMLKKGGYTFTVKGIESVEGKDAYNIEIKSPAGRLFNFFYDVVSGLRVKEMKEQDGGPAGKAVVQVFNHTFKEFNGIKLPVSILIDLGQLKINVEIVDVKVNQGLKLDDLK